MERKSGSHHTRSNWEGIMSWIKDHYRKMKMMSPFKIRPQERIKIYLGPWVKCTKEEITTRWSSRYILTWTIIDLSYLLEIQLNHFMYKTNGHLNNNNKIGRRQLKSNLTSTNNNMQASTIARRIQSGHHHWYKIILIEIVGRVLCSSANISSKKRRLGSVWGRERKREVVGGRCIVHVMIEFLIAEEDT